MPKNSLSSQNVCPKLREVVHLNKRVFVSTDELAIIELQCTHGRMALHCINIFVWVNTIWLVKNESIYLYEIEEKDTFTRIDVPQLDSGVAGSSNELVALELKAVDHVVMALKGMETASRHVPHLNESVVTSTNQQVVVELKAVHLVSMCSDSVEASSIHIHDLIKVDQKIREKINK